MEIACIAVPRFELLVACKGDRELLRRPVVLTSSAKGGAVVREVSGAAEARGVRKGMRLARAWAQCDGLRHAIADPLRAEVLWERVLLCLEGIGAEVESEESGQAFFEAAPLHSLLGGGSAAVLAAARGAVGMPVRASVAPSRFASFIAAVMARGRSAVLGSEKERIVSAGDLHRFLEPLSVSSLLVGPGLDEEDARELTKAFDELGIRTLGDLTSISANRVADRFGRRGLFARRLALGEDRKLHPRGVTEEARAELDLEGGSAGVHLERGLEALVERLLASPQRGGRSILSVRLAARLEMGGSWVASQTFGTPTASLKTLTSLLMRRLEELPAPPAALSLRATELGPGVGDQLALSTRRGRAGDDQLAETVRQLESLQGREALLEVLDLDPTSRLPERRAVLVPRSRERRR